MRTLVSVGRLAVVGLVAVSMLSACGDDDGNPASDRSVTKLVGPAGGTVELAGGGKVVIPAGALDKDVTISITKLELDDVEPLPDNLEPAGKPYAFQPHGTKFTKTVQMEIPFDGQQAPQVRPLKLNDEEDTDWRTIVGSTKNAETGKVTFDTTSFSVILAARPRRGSGVITLPDGATIPEDAGEAGVGGMSGTGGTGGNAGMGGSAGTGIAGTGGTTGNAGVGGTIDDAGVMDASGEFDAGTCMYDPCGSDCVDTEVDSDHCGACDNHCGAGEICRVGACECPQDHQCARYGSGTDGDAGVSELDAGAEGIYTCRDLANDSLNCGACNNACEIGNTCVEGSCEPIVCPSGQQLCGGSCVDTASDLNNCGGCAPPAGEPDDGLTCYVEDSECIGYCYAINGTLCSIGNDYDECVDANIDRNNCGQCGVVCANDEECVLGSCDVLACPAGQTACDGRCVDGNTCGSVCLENGVCNAGTCECATGTALCDGDNGQVCADLDASVDHCGQCNYGCGYDTNTCVDGECECAGVNVADCEGQCADLDSDDYNCGSCYNYCYSNEQCVAGECVPRPCEGNQVLCNGYCTDTDTDGYNCGGCAPSSNYDAETCMIGETCDCDSYGLTTCSVGDGYGFCTDTDADRLNCGACDNACASGNECVGGTCQPIDCGDRTLCGWDCVDSPSCGVECDWRYEYCDNGVCEQEDL